MLLEKSTGDWNEENKCQINKPVYLDLYILVIRYVWVHKTMAWRQDKTMLHWSGQPHSLHKFGKHLYTDCARHIEKKDLIHETTKLTDQCS